jgi:hypothetical protein
MRLAAVSVVRFGGIIGDRAEVTLSIDMSSALSLIPFSAE